MTSQKGWYNMNMSLFPEKDPNGERRRVLAKVYGLLLRLADEAEKEKASALTPPQIPQEEIPTLASDENSIPEATEENDVALKNDVPS